MILCRESVRGSNGKLEVIWGTGRWGYPHRAGEHNGVVDFIGRNGLTSIHVEFGTSR